jgi:hypothetical protein
VTPDATKIPEDELTEMIFVLSQFVDLEMPFSEFNLKYCSLIKNNHPIFAQHEKAAIWRYCQEWVEYQYVRSYVHNDIRELHARAKKYLDEHGEGVVA